MKEQASSPNEDWVEVATFQGWSADIEADMTVTTLQGNDIPALRLPAQPLTAVAGALAIMVPIRVWVPPDQEEKARQLLADFEAGDGS
jgi:hypothetical protein